MTKDILHRTRYLSKQETKQDLNINFYIGNILIIVHRETKKHLLPEKRETDYFPRNGFLRHLKEETKSH